MSTKESESCNLTPAVDDLIAIQAINQSELERCIRNYKKTAKDKLKEGYITERKNLLTAQWQTIEKTHRTLLKLYTSQHKEIKYFKDDVYSDMEEAYCQACGLMTDHLLSLKTPPKSPSPNTLSVPSAPYPTSTPSTRSENTDIKLPRINIPTFAGNYVNWPSFHDLFLSLIHENKQLSNVHKLHYLRSSVSGEAENLIKHLQLTESNYTSAWELLRGRYHNNRILVTAQLNVLTSMPNHSQETAYHLKRMLDKLNEVLEALKGLKVITTNWDPLIIHLLTQKLNRETITHWETNLSAREDTTALPTINEFKDFIERRFRTLESIGGTKNNPREIKFDNKYDITKVHVTQPYQLSNPAHEKRIVLNCPLCNKLHILRECPQFTKMTPNERLNFILRNGRCCNCFGKTHNTSRCPKRSSCHKCQKRHNTMLHLDNNSNPSSRTNAPNTEPRANHKVPQSYSEESPSPVHTYLAEKPIHTSMLLATALIKVHSTEAGTITLRALVDQGSQASFITERSAQLLKLKKKPTFVSITGIGNTESEPTRGIINLKFGAHFKNEQNIDLQAFVIKRITGKIPSHSTSPQRWPHLEGLQLADPYYFNAGDIDILLGVDAYAKIVQDGVVKGAPNSPIAQYSTLGWILCGPITTISQIPPTISLVCTNEPTINELLRRFWEVEEVHNKRHFTKEELVCENFFQTTHKRLPTGRYELKLPFKSYPATPVLGESRAMALKRFLNMERKLIGNPTLRMEYKKFMDEYVNLGHMEIAEDDDPANGTPNYLPHHSVIKEDSTTTKVRVVFDASAKTTNHTSLNDHLIAGPTIQDDLAEILLRWRIHKYTFTADIEKMYRQIRIAREDTDYQRILWREELSEPIKEYRLLTVTYGTSSAPFLAIRTLHQLARDEEGAYPTACKAILRDFYVDDFMSGASTEDEAMTLQQEVRHVLKRGGLHLRKWTSNSNTSLNGVPNEDREIKTHPELNINNTIKTLGIHWNPSTDCFQFKIKPLTNNPKTKRNLLSEIAKLFDPLGWMAPIVITTKIIMQQLWLIKTDWDQQLPDAVLHQWQEFRADLPQIEKISIPRWLQISPETEFQVHGFCDASIQAYAAVLYLRTRYGNDYRTTLMVAKTRVAPTKQLSLPRLELCAASLLAKLVKQVRLTILRRPFTVYLWSDSTIALSWIQGHPSKWTTFVGNRVSDIQTETDGCFRRYVPTKDNPADCASRGVRPTELKDHKIWWNGPVWLNEEPDKWPENIVKETKLETRKIKVHVASSADPTNDLLTRYSTWSKLLRIIALCIRFCNNCRNPQQMITGYVRTEELRGAKKLVIKLAQAQAFPEEVHALQNMLPLNKKSSIHNLNPFLDNQNILRVGGRLKNSDIPYMEKHPIILGAAGHVTNLIIDDAHILSLHGGVQLTLATIRREYWIIHSRRVVRQKIHKCLTCWRYKAAAPQQLMGSLPEARVTRSRPFQNVGIDFCGPIAIKESKCRGRVKTSKGYVSVFICLSTKAIHLEAVSELSTNAFLAAFRRFVARRGLSTHIYSDCGTNFIGASRQLSAINLQREWGLTEEMYSRIEQMGIKWHFIPPGAPHFGGLWESGVRSTKHHLKRVMADSLLTFEEISTLLAQIEACLNSRPLCPLSDDPDDTEVLTPGHFLIGSALIAPPEENVIDKNISSLNRWKHIQHMNQSFWRKWQKEYLHRLQQRPKWLTKNPNIGEGNLVLIKDERLPPTSWALGRVVEVHPGSDGLVRVVTIKSRNSIFKRPITKICLLPIEDNQQQISNSTNHPNK